MTKRTRKTSAKRGADTSADVARLRLERRTAAHERAVAATINRVDIEYLLTRIDALLDRHAADIAVAVSRATFDAVQAIEAGITERIATAHLGALTALAEDDSGVGSSSAPSAPVAHKIPAGARAETDNGGDGRHHEDHWL